MFSRIQANKINYESLFEKNYDNYSDIVDLINNDFKIEGYDEILHDKNFFLALPIESKETDLIGRQKLFVYKNPDKECIILLSVTASKYNNLHEKEEWSSSYSYYPMMFNNKEGEYKSSYSSVYPDVQVATNSFNLNGCHISLLSISNNYIINDKEIDTAAEELVNFSNNLLVFLENKGINRE